MAGISSSIADALRPPMATGEKIELPLFSSWKFLELETVTHEVDPTP